MLEKIATILLVNLLFYAKTLTYKYSSDDIPAFQNPPNFKNKLDKILCWLDGRSRHHPQWDHFLTMIIHSLICVFIYIGFGASDISFLAALLFAFNPTGNQGSVWISGRSYALAALGMTGALAFPYLSIFFLWLCTYTNPGFLAPIALIGSSVYWVLLFYPLAIIFNIERFSTNVNNKIEKEMLSEDKAIKLEKFILATKTFGFYTTMALIPFKNAFYHAFLQSASGIGKEKAYSPKDRFFWLGVIYILGIITYWLLTPWSMISFGLLWWIVCLAPFCNFVRCSQEIAERYTYLPLAGLMYALAALLISNPILAAAFVTMYATRMWFYMDCYTDDYYLLEHSCINDPSAWFCWHVRAIKRWDNKSFQEAIILWSMARMISPKEFKINFNIATVLAMSKHVEEAKQYLKIAEDNIPLGQEEQCRGLISEWRKGNCSIVI